MHFMFAVANHQLVAESAGQVAALVGTKFVYNEAGPFDGNCHLDSSPFRQFVF